MINREKREAAGRLVKQLLARELSNDDFVAKYPRSDEADKAIGAIFEALWFYWDDLHTHRLQGKYALDSNGKALFERCLGFLASDLEYEWPTIQRVSIKNVFLRIAGLSRAANKRTEEFEQKMNEYGDWRVWPFIREADLPKDQPT